MRRSSLCRAGQLASHFSLRPVKYSAMAASRPTGLVAKKGIELLTFATPNGYKASIMLEELKEAYGRDYTFQSINIMQNIQKEAWFTRLGPNGRIPVIVDHDQGGFAVMEGAAILTYLARHYDGERRFSFTDPLDVSVCEQWLAWQAGGLGPMAGQAGVFYRYARDKIPFAINRYVGESERLLGVLDIRLADRDYLAGQGRGRYSIADIATFGWVNGAPSIGIDLDQFQHVVSWLKRISVRPAVQRGLKVPFEPAVSYANYKQKLADDASFREAEDKLHATLKKAQEQYDYKFKAP